MFQVKDGTEKLAIYWRQKQKDIVLHLFLVEKGSQPFNEILLVVGSFDFSKIHTYQFKEKIVRKPRETFPPLHHPLCLLFPLESLLFS